MGSHILQTNDVVLVGALLAVVVVCLLGMVRTKKPDSKMTLLLDLRKGLPREEGDESPGEEIPGGNDNDEDEAPVVQGPRSYDFFA